MCGSKNKTTTAKTSPAPEAMAYYKQLLGQLQSVGQLGYTPYEGQRIAGFTPYQQQAMQGIAGLQGAGAGTLQQAVQAGQRGAAAITPEDIQRYQNPYQQAVIDAMNAQIRQQENIDLSKLQGTAISSGAFGGDRAQVAQAQLMADTARERDARISDLLSKGYTSSLAAAQADREAATRGAGMLQSLAGSEFTQPLAELQALYGAGAQQQALEQQQLNVPYETYLEQRAFPYQQLQYLAGIGTGVGSQMGGVGKTTEPGPSILSQIIGAGLSAGSMAMGMPPSDERLKENIEDVGTTHDGQTIYKYNFKGSPMTHIGLLAQEVENKHPEAVGQTAGFKTVNYDLATRDAVRKADGGGLGQTAMFQKSYIPTIDIAKGRGAPEPPKPAQKEQDPTHDAVDKAMALANKMMSKSTDPTNPASWQTTTTLSPENPASWNTAVTPVETMSPLSPSMLFPTYAHGGGINIPHYPNGGGVEEEPSNRIIGLSTVARKLLEEKTPTETASKTDLLPIEINQPDKSNKPPVSGFDETYGSQDTSYTKGKSLLGSLLGLSPEAEQATMAAGLAMMAGQSPYALSNIGSGGLAGVKYYNELMKAKQEQALKEKEIAAKGHKPPKKSGLVTSKGDAVYFDENDNPVFFDGKPVPPGEETMLESVYKEKTKQQAKTEVNLKKDQSRLSTQVYENQRAKADLEKAKSKIGYLTTGFLGVPLSKIPGTSAADLAEDIKSIQARLGFEQLQIMRQNSPTGGALGNVSNQEIAYLQSAVESLSTNQSPEQLKQKFDEIAIHLNRIEEIQKQAFAQQYGEDKLFETLPQTGETAPQQTKPYQQYPEGQKIQYGDGSMGIIKNGKEVPYEGKP